MQPFIPFSAAHWGGLAAAAVAVALVVVFRAPLRHRRTRIALAAVLVGSEIALYSSYTIRDVWGWYALPLQLCTLTLWLSVYVLLSRNRKVYEVVFYLGILGAVQALATPYLTVTFPDFRYFHFFLAHTAIIAASVYMTTAEGYRPTFRSVFRALLWLNVLAVPAAVVNALTGENFMFLSRKPPTGSMLDWLAPWPWYILQLEVIALLLCMALFGILKASEWLRRRSRLA